LIACIVRFHQSQEKIAVYVSVQKLRKKKTTKNLIGWEKVCVENLMTCAKNQRSC
jgi:Tfp pilus assembly protein PilV